MPQCVVKIGGEKECIQSFGVKYRLENQEDGMKTLLGYQGNKL
jgi:hypothetical protein